MSNVACTARRVIQGEACMIPNEQSSTARTSSPRPARPDTARSYSE